MQQTRSLLRTEFTNITTWFGRSHRHSELKSLNNHVATSILIRTGCRYYGRHCMVNRKDLLPTKFLCPENTFRHNLYQNVHRCILRPGVQGVSLVMSKNYATEPMITAKVRGIQKDISPLTTRRIVRRKRSKDALPRDQEVFDVVAYATAEEINLESLRIDFEKQGLYGINPLPSDAVDALQFNAKYRVDDEPREIVVFREGSVVFWNMPEVERKSVLLAMRRHQEDSYDSLLIMHEYEQVEFTYTETSTKLVGDELQLQKPNSESLDGDHQLEKYSFSNALALSVKLAIWEASLAKYVDDIEYILEDLKNGKKIKISRGEVLRKTGELFTLRHLINLSSDLLDTPDFYWDRERLEHLYTKTCNYLNIARRTKVMNEKLHHCCELTDLLSSNLNDKHHTRLEWMIIILILVEVLFEVARMIEKQVKGKGE